MTNKKTARRRSLNPPPADVTVSPRRVSKKVITAIDKMVSGECRKIADAAQQVGLARESLKQALQARVQITGHYPIFSGGVPCKTATISRALSTPTISLISSSVRCGRSGKSFGVVAGSLTLVIAGSGTLMSSAIGSRSGFIRLG
jgi:hypothetical protein